MDQVRGYYYCCQQFLPPFRPLFYNVASVSGPLTAPPSPYRLQSLGANL